MNRSERTPGVIAEGEAYTLAELRRRAGLGHSALRLARSKGLRIRRLGRKLFVTGRDFLAFLDGLDAGESPEPSK